MLTSRQAPFAAAFPFLLAIAFPATGCPSGGEASPVAIVAAPIGASPRAGAPAVTPDAPSSARQEIAAAVRALSNPDSSARLDGVARLVSRRDELTVDDLRSGLLSCLARTRETCVFLLGHCSDSKADRALLSVAVQDTDAGVRSAAFDALRKRLGPDTYKPIVTLAVSARRLDTRLRALSFLEDLREPEVVPVLTGRLEMAAGIGASAANNNAAAGGADGGGDDAFIFVGSQTSIVGDFDVSVAQGAVIADPIVTPVTSGALLRVRNVSVRIAPRERDAIWAAILASAGATRKD
jgi:hypothetical protein